MPKDTFPGKTSELVEAARVIKEESKNLFDKLVVLVEENDRLQKRVQNDENIRTFHKREIERIQVCLEELEKMGKEGRQRKPGKRRGRKGA